MAFNIDYQIGILIFAGGNDGFAQNTIFRFAVVSNFVASITDYGDIQPITAHYNLSCMCLRAIARLYFSFVLVISVGNSLRTAKCQSN